MPALLTKGRVLEAHLNTERGVASRGGDPRPPPREARDPARRALRPGREELAVTDPEAIPVREARDPTVERREAGVPRHGTQGASLGAWPAALRAGPTGASQAPDDSRRSATPSIGVAKPKFQNPGAKKRAAGTKRCCLVLTLSVRHSGRAAIAARAGIHNHRWRVWIPGSQASPAPRNDAERACRGCASLAGRGGRPSAA